MYSMAEANSKKVIKNELFQNKILFSSQLSMVG